MSTARNESVLDILAAINTILQLIARSNTAVLELMAQFEKARAENRELTDDELDALRQKALNARDRLTGTVHPQLLP